MKPLIVLLAVFLITLMTLKFLRGQYDLPLAGRISMSAMLLFTAVGHFAFTKGMTMMLPQFIPFKPAIVYLTGVFEIMAAIALLIPSLRVYTAWFLIIFFLVLLPANIYSAIQHIDYQKGTYDGPGLKYLWFRIPLQIIFIGWTYLSSIRF